TMVLTKKYFDGKIPEPGAFNAGDDACIKAMEEAPRKIGEAIESFKMREALNELMNLARVGNKYLAENEPWKVINTDEKRVKTVLFLSLNITAYLTALSEPFLPFTSDKLHAMLKMEKATWNDLNGFLLEPHHHLGE